MKDEATPEMIAMARRIVADFWRREPGHHSEKPEIDPILDGDEDRSIEVRVVLAAIIETQRRDAKLAETHGYHPCPPEQVNTEPPEGVLFWGCSIDNRTPNQPAIATAIRAGHHYGKDSQ